MDTKKIFIIIGLTVGILIFVAILTTWPTVGAILGGAGVIAVSAGVRSSLDRHRDDLTEVDRSVERLRDIVAENEHRSEELGELNDETDRVRARNAKLREQAATITANYNHTTEHSNRN